MSKDYKKTYLKDYQPPAFEIYRTDLNFLIKDPTVLVEACLYIKRKGGNSNEPLILMGKSLNLRGVVLDHRQLSESEYQKDDHSLTILRVPMEFELKLTTYLLPKDNLSLSGLYQSKGTFCTQCEAEGFRRITYYLDRPDNLSKFNVRIEAKKEQYPVILSNGDEIHRGEMGSRHFVHWEDPFPKPAYLFALVVGNLACYEDNFITQSNREISLKIYVEPGKETRCVHAMRSLKKAMRWDEIHYGREYDLTCFMIVAVSDFNMGAMENKGLNIFNDKYILADPNTATDQDYQAIARVVAHEYFHNWTGNRVTCRDWFQLSLKEGLTVFRDQSFSSDQYARAVHRIEDVARLKQFQFKEDAGPNAHPVQPDAYIEINNFYTTTIYEKGAELIRMLHTLLGVDGFRRGTDLYFERHDGQAVTIQDFVQALADANQKDLSAFMPWYQQAGTPVLTVQSEYDASQKCMTVDFSQNTPNTPGQTTKVPLMIPIQYAVIGPKHYSESKLFVLNKVKDQLRIDNVASDQVLSVLQNFSAPVKLNYKRSLHAWLTLLAYDFDGVNRYEAVQIVYRTLIERAYQEESIVLEAETQAAFKALVADPHLDRALKAKLLCFPSLANILSDHVPINMERLSIAHQQVRDQWIGALTSELLLLIDSIPLATKSFEMDTDSIAQRALRHTCLNLLATQRHPKARRLLREQFEQACNMTDQANAFQALVWFYPEERQAAIAQFYDQWQSDHLVLDKWFSIQARVPEKDALKAIFELTQHAQFNLKNPNRVRSVLSAWIHFNPIAFHHPSGEGYTFLAEYIQTLDQSNPQISARLAVAFENWKQFSNPQCDFMRQTIDNILAKGNLSKDTYEILSKSLIVS